MASNIPRRKTTAYRSTGDAPLGCIVPFVLLWIVGVLLSLGLTAALIYLAISFAQSL